MSHQSSLTRAASWKHILGMQSPAAGLHHHHQPIQQRSGSTSALKCSLYIFKICTGAGLLGIPHIYSQAGILTSVALTAVLVLFNVISCRLLIRCRDIMLVAKSMSQSPASYSGAVSHDNDDSESTINIIPIEVQPGTPQSRSHADTDDDHCNDSFGELACYTLGRIGIVVVDASICICLLGVVALYLITFTVLMSEVMSDTPSYYLIAAATLFLVPFVFIRNLSGLGFVSALSTLAYIVAFVTIFWYGSRCQQCESKRDHAAILLKKQVNWTVGSASSVASAFGALTFSLGIPVMSTTLEEELQRPQQFNRTLHLSMIVVCISYCLIGVSGVVLFDHVEPIVISNLPSSSAVTSCVKLMVAVTLLLSCPLSLVPSLNLLELGLDTQSHHNSASGTPLRAMLTESNDSDDLYHRYGSLEDDVTAVSTHPTGNIADHQPLTAAEIIRFDNATPAHSPFAAQSYQSSNGDNSSEVQSSNAISHKLMNTDHRAGAQSLKLVDSMSLRNLMRMGVLLGVVTVAFVVPCFTLLMSVLGCVTFSLLCFILPPLFAIQLHRSGDDKLYADYLRRQAANADDLTTDSTPIKAGVVRERASSSVWTLQTHYVLSWIYLVIGAMTSVFSTAIVLQHAKCT